MRPEREERGGFILWREGTKSRAVLFSLLVTRVGLEVERHYGSSFEIMTTGKNR